MCRWRLSIPAIYNIAQAAALLGVSRVTIWRWIRDGRIPVARLGHRTIRIKRTDLERMLIEHEPSSSLSSGGQDAVGEAVPADGAMWARAPRAGWWEVGPNEHLVQFYDTDAFLLDAVSDFIGAAVRAGGTGIIIATLSHRQELDVRLRAYGLDIAAARAQGRYVDLDAAETLSRFVVGGSPEPMRFSKIMGEIIEGAAAGRHVRIFGEMVSLLALEGDFGGAMRLEELWCTLQEIHQFALFCAYPLECLDQAAQAGFAGDVCNAHSRVIPAESYTALDDPEDRLRAIALLQQQARSLDVEVVERRRVERRLAVQYAATRILSESETLAQAAAPILQCVCETLGWEVGALWSLDRQTGGLRCENFWRTTAVDLAEFEAISREWTFLSGEGLPGRVWAGGEPAWIPDVLVDDNFPRAPYAATAALHGACGFPIRAGNAILGTIEFFSREIRQPDEEMLALMAGVGSQIGQFIERRRAEEERLRLFAAERQARADAEAALRRLQAMQAISDVALAHLSTRDLLQELLTRLTEVLGVDNSAILIPSGDGRHLVLHLARGPEEQIAGQVCVPIGEGIAGTIAATRRSLVVDDLDMVEVANPFLKQTIRSLMGVPLVVENRLIGVLHAGTVAPRHFTEDDVQLLRLVGDRIGLALDNARLYEEEQRLHAQAARQAGELEAIFEAITDGIFVFGQMGEVWRWNVAARDLLGMDAPTGEYTQPMHVRDQRTEVWDAQGRSLPQAQWPLFRVLGGEVLTGEHAADHLVRRHDGVMREVSVSGAPIRDPQGTITGAVCVLRDVSERRRLEARILAERNWLHQVLDVLPEGILIAGANPPSVVAMNQAAKDLLGIDLVGQPVPILPPGVQAEYAPRRLDGTLYPTEELPLERALLRGEVVRSDQFQIRNATTGQDVTILANSAPLWDAQRAVDGAVAVFQDITALKELERQREQFLATVSHDLKNPLTSILGMSQLLQLRARRAEPDLARLGEGLESIGETARRMAVQIDDLLDVVRMQMGRPLHLDLAPADVRALVAQLVDEYQRTTERHALRLVESPDTPVWLVDAARLQRAIANLLANAIKYSPQGGEILITVACAEDQEETWLTITVADHGVGIPAAEVAHVFDGFYRASNVTGQFQGTGLGLRGVRQIIRHHGGIVAVDSTVGVGTSVTVRLPPRPSIEASA